MNGNERQGKDSASAECGLEQKKQIITIKLRLRDKHAAELGRQARAINYVWNYCNETSAKAWSRDRRWLSTFDLQKLTAGSSKELGILSQTIKCVCDQFTRSRDKAKKASIRWRGRKSLGWVPFSTGTVSFNGDTFKFRGILFEAMHLHPEIQRGVRIYAGSFNQDNRGRWYLNAAVKIECESASGGPAVGIDLGLKDFAALSTGEKIEAPRFYRKSEETLATMQRSGKTTKRIRNIHAKIANRRRDFLHKASANIAKTFGVILVGDVSPKKLARTTMAKSVHDAGWSSFRNMLAYKAIRHGARFVETSERMSSQVCSECGGMPPSRPRGIAGLVIREWRCDDCGAVHDRDVNAARNILRVGLDTLAEGAFALAKERPFLFAYPVVGQA